MRYTVIAIRKMLGTLEDITVATRDNVYEAELNWEELYLALDALEMMIERKERPDETRRLKPGIHRGGCVCDLVGPQSNDLGSD